MAGTWVAFSASSGTVTGPALGVYYISTNATSSTLSVSQAVAGMNGYQFRFLYVGYGYFGAPLTLSVTPSGVIYVDAAAAPGGNGLTWATAFNSLQGALSAVGSGTCVRNIWMAAGTYYPTTGGDTSARFNLPAGAAIYGGFLSGQTNLVQRNWQANPTTILSGDLGTPGVTTDNSQIIVNIDGNRHSHRDRETVAWTGS